LSVLHNFVLQAWQYELCNSIQTRLCVLTPRQLCKLCRGLFYITASNSGTPSIIVARKEAQVHGLYLPILLVLLNISCNLWADWKLQLISKRIENNWNTLLFSWWDYLHFLGAIESFRRGAQSGSPMWIFVH
jgi:hypothetical protein